MFLNIAAMLFSAGMAMRCASGAGFSSCVVFGVFAGMAVGTFVAAGFCSQSMESVPLPRQVPQYVSHAVGVPAAGPPSTTNPSPARMATCGGTSGRRRSSQAGPRADGPASRPRAMRPSATPPMANSAIEDAPSENPERMLMIREIVASARLIVALSIGYLNV